MLEFAHTLASAWIAAPATESSLSMPLAVCGALVVAGAAFVGSRWQQERRRREALEAQLATHRDKQADVKSRERALKEAQTTQREEMQGLKQDMGAQRKKNHALQEDLRKLREQLREQIRLREEAQNSRPAFADMDRERDKPGPFDLGPGETAAKAPKATAAVPPKPEPKVEAPIAKPAPSPEVLEALHDAKVRQLQHDLDAARSALETERTTSHAQRDELKRLRRRAEDLRRIDIITKAKMELLEDKLRGLGRQYYDAISELAAARGEVIPPRPRELAPPEPAEDRRAEAEALAEAVDEEMQTTNELGVSVTVQ